MEASMIVRCQGSHIFQIIGSQMVVRLLALCAGHPLPPGRLLVLISVRGCVDPRAIRIRSIEKFSDLIGNRTHDLRACSIVPEPTTLPHAPSKMVFYQHFLKWFKEFGYIKVSICRSTNYHSQKGALFSSILSDTNSSPIQTENYSNLRVHLLDIPNFLKVSFIFYMFWCTLLGCAYIWSTGFIVKESCLSVWCLLCRHFSMNPLEFVTGAINEILVYDEWLIWNSVFMLLQ
jgi:hypothetical protein